MKRSTFHFLLSLFLLSSFLMGCQPASFSPEPEPVPHAYITSDAPLLNPERGFFTPHILPGPAGFSATRALGNTLVHLNIRLDDWRETDIPQNVLDGLNTNFADIRGAGVKAIIRFAYNEGPWPNSEPDASKAQILRHIEQLTPLLQQNADIIGWVEAGFIGAWGEWHTSTNGLDNLTDKRDILHALLAASPNRYVQVRYPANIIEMYPDPTDAASARVAHHNDCFLSSDTDVGTYERDGINTIERDQNYLAELTRLTPMSGETCAPNPPRSECASAIQEMELLHFSAINEAYHKGILRSWEAGGCMEEITQRMGYRLSLSSADFNEQVRPGGLLHLSVDLTNTGFASLMNPRPLYVVLQSANSTLLTKLELDPRSWQPGTSSFTAAIRLPSKMEEMEYNLSLWLPDEAETLHSNALYAVQFANEGTWDESTGYNILGKVRVDASATGSYKRSDQMEVEKLDTVGTSPLPASTPAPTTTPEVLSGDLITNPGVARDGENLIIHFEFAGDVASYNAFQVFIDVDQDHETGMLMEDGTGADFLLENDTLNVYVGSGSDWTWLPVDETISFSNSDRTATWIMPGNALGEDLASITIVLQLVGNDWDTAFLTRKLTFKLK